MLHGFDWTCAEYDSCADYIDPIQNTLCNVFADNLTDFLDDGYCIQAGQACCYIGDLGGIDEYGFTPIVVNTN